jgi:hypothetical protein
MRVKSLQSGQVSTTGAFISSWHCVEDNRYKGSNYGSVHIISGSYDFEFLLTDCGLTKQFVFLFSPTIHPSSMPQNQVLDASSDEENKVPPVPHPQKTCRKARDNLSENVQLPNRTCGASDHTVLAKQQAISKCFYRVPHILADVH